MRKPRVQVSGCTITGYTLVGPLPAGYAPLRNVVFSTYRAAQDLANWLNMRFGPND